jgi:hypothetical protein
MTAACTLEKEFGQFKTMNSIACDSFILSSTATALIDEFEKELQEIKARIEGD